VVGEALIDIVQPPSGQPHEHVGGSPANVAIGLARLGHRTRLATYLGSDVRGRRIADLLAAEQVELSVASQTASRTSTATAKLNAAGAATYDFDLTWELDPTQVGIEPGGHLHTGSIAATLEPGATGVAEAVAAAQAACTISYDPNVRPSLMGTPEQARPIIERLIRLSDVVKASDEDIGWLYPGKPLHQVLADWATLGPAICATTRGGNPAVALVAGEFFYRLPLLSTVIDTVGAGDSFMSGLLSGLLDGNYLGGTAARERLRFAKFDDLAGAFDRAVACSAVTVSRAGANPPTRAELRIEF
jgi:fructokinase